MAVEIKDRKVRIKEAHCPNKLCIMEGWISRGAIVCLPNKIVVKIVGVKDKKKHRNTDSIDAITG
jgi:hypothetical protein